LSTSDRDAIVNFLKGSPDDSGLTVLVGPNWTINGKGADLIQPKLGGIVVKVSAG
jgi:hypothetical protein